MSQLSRVTVAATPFLISPMDQRCPDGEALLRLDSGSAGSQSWPRKCNSQSGQSVKIMGDMMIEMGSFEHEHEEFMRAEAVKIAMQLHKYAPKLDEVLRDAETIVEFIIKNRGEKPAAEIIPIGIVPKDGGDAA